MLILVVGIISGELAQFNDINAYIIIIIISD